MDPQQLPLRDLHLPEAIGWWPLAPGWWFLIALAALTLGWLLWRAYLQWRGNRARRVALGALRTLVAEHKTNPDDLRLAKELSALTRRAMLAYAPRQDVAGLTGEAWLQWLDRGLPGRPFTEGQGRALESMPYRDRLPDDGKAEITALIEAVRLRLQTPLPQELR